MIQTIPKVSKETYEATLAELQRKSTGENQLLRHLEKIKVENPEIERVIASTMLNLQLTGQPREVIFGFILVYEMLKRQFEADQMNYFYRLLEKDSP